VFLVLRYRQSRKSCVTSNERLALSAFIEEMSSIEHNNATSCCLNADVSPSVSPQRNNIHSATRSADLQTDTGYQSNIGTHADTGYQSSNILRYVENVDDSSHQTVSQQSFCQQASCHIPAAGQLAPGQLAPVEHHASQLVDSLPVASVEELGKVKLNDLTRTSLETVCQHTNSSQAELLNERSDADYFMQQDTQGCRTPRCSMDYATQGCCTPANMDCMTPGRYLPRVTESTPNGCSGQYLAQDDGRYLAQADNDMSLDVDSFRIHMNVINT